MFEQTVLTDGLGDDWLFIEVGDGWVRCSTGEPWDEWAQDYYVDYYGWFQSLEETSEYTYRYFEGFEHELLGLIIVVEHEFVDDDGNRESRCISSDYFLPGEDRVGVVSELQEPDPPTETVQSNTFFNELVEIAQRIVDSIPWDGAEDEWEAFLEETWNQLLEGREEDYFSIARYYGSEIRFGRSSDPDELTLEARSGYRRANTRITNISPSTQPPGEFEEDYIAFPRDVWYDQDVFVKHEQEPQLVDVNITFTLPRAMAWDFSNGDAIDFPKHVRGDVYHRPGINRNDDDFDKPWMQPPYAPADLYLEFLVNDDENHVGDRYEFIDANNPYTYDEDEEEITLHDSPLLREWFENSLQPREGSDSKDLSLTLDWLADAHHHVAPGNPPPGSAAGASYFNEVSVSVGFDAGNVWIEATFDFGPWRYFKPGEPEDPPLRFRQRSDELLGHGPRVENAGNSPTTQQRSTRHSGQTYF